MKQRRHRGDDADEDDAGDHVAAQLGQGDARVARPEGQPDEELRGEDRLGGRAEMDDVAERQE